MPVPPSFAAGALYDDLLRSALERFFPRAELSREALLSESSFGRLSVEPTDDPHVLTVRWFGTRHTLRVLEGHPFSGHEVRLARAIGAVLAARYRAIFEPRLMVERGDLFQGAVDDRYVGAFVDQEPYTVEGKDTLAQRIASAIEVLRVAALSSYENTAISSGVIILRRDDVSDGRAPAATRLPYTQRLTQIKSFYRLCDGLRTVFLLDANGRVADFVDLEHFAGDLAGTSPTVPCPRAYRAHARATATGHVCVVLSPSREIKVFAEGAPVFTFRHGNWHLLDMSASYARWVRAVGRPALAESLFQTALDLAEAREGALFVVLRDPAQAIPTLLAATDRLDVAPSKLPGAVPTRRELLELVAARNVMRLDASLLAALASMDGALVTDADGTLIAAGAILLHPVSLEGEGGYVTEGARTTAASAASRFGAVLKVSQDGVITIYDRGQAWDI